MLYLAGLNTDSIKEILLGRIGLLATRAVINFFIVTSYDLLNLLKKICPYSRIVLIPPIVPVEKHDHGILLASWNVCDIRKKATVTYIGNLLPNRVDVVKSLLILIKAFDPSRIHLNIYSLIIDKKYLVMIKNLTKKYNVYLTLHHKYLTAHEKCEVLKRSDFFISPNPLATMHPPLSILEALYHGVIPIPFRPYYLALIRNTPLFDYYLNYYKQLATIKV